MPPTKFAHVVFQTNRLKEMSDWYCSVLGGHIIYQSTTSMYYRDPDGNRIELQIDNFATAQEGQAWMHSAAFDRNPIGVEFDPDELTRKFQAGVPLAELVARE